MYYTTLIVTYYVLPSASKYYQHTIFTKNSYIVALGSESNNVRISLRIDVDNTCA